MRQACYKAIHTHKDTSTRSRFRLDASSRWSRHSSLPVPTNSMREVSESRMPHIFSCTSRSKLILSGFTCSQFLSTKIVKPFALFCIEAAELYWRDSVSLPVISASTGMELPARIEKTCLISVPYTLKSNGWKESVVQPQSSL